MRDKNCQSNQARRGVLFSSLRSNPNAGLLRLARRKHCVSCSRGSYEPKNSCVMPMSNKNYMGNLFLWSIAQWESRFSSRCQTASNGEWQPHHSPPKSNCSSNLRPDPRQCAENAPQRARVPPRMSPSPRSPKSTGCRGRRWAVHWASTRTRASN